MLLKLLSKQNFFKSLGSKTGIKQIIS